MMLYNSSKFSLSNVLKRAWVPTVTYSPGIAIVLLLAPSGDFISHPRMEFLGRVNYWHSLDMRNDCVEAERLPSS